jgi:hypothetical protein
MARHGDGRFPLITLVQKHMCVLFFHFLWTARWDGEERTAFGSAHIG